MKKILRVPINMSAEEALECFKLMESIKLALCDAYQEEFTTFARRRLIERLEDEDGLEEKRIPF